MALGAIEARPPGNESAKATTDRHETSFGKIYKEPTHCLAPGVAQPTRITLNDRGFLHARRAWPASCNGNLAV